MEIGLRRFKCNKSRRVKRRSMLEQKYVRAEVCRAEGVLAILFYDRIEVSVGRTVLAKFLWIILFYDRIEMYVGRTVL